MKGFKTISAPETVEYRGGVHLSKTLFYKKHLQNIYLMIEVILKLIVWAPLLFYIIY
jgi:hypothetical protein